MTKSRSTPPPNLLFLGYACSSSFTPNQLLLGYACSSIRRVSLVKFPRISSSARPILFNYSPPNLLFLGYSSSSIPAPTQEKSPPSSSLARPLFFNYSPPKSSIPRLRLLVFIHPKSRKIPAFSFTRPPCFSSSTHRITQEVSPDK